MSGKELQALVTELSKLKSQDDINAFFSTSTAEKLKSIIEYLLKNNKTDTISILKQLLTLLPHNPNDKTNGNENNSNGSIGKKIHLLVTFELLVGGVLFLVYPEKMISLLNFSKWLHHGDESTNYQFIRIIGGLMFVLGLHYLYEYKQSNLTNNTNYLKLASFGRIVFGIISAYLIKNNLIEKQNYLFSLSDLIGGLIGLKSLRNNDNKLSKL